MASSPILEELDRLLASPTFARSPKLARLLSYLVRAELEGRTESLKEVVIAAEVYGKSESYDPNIDSLVRVEVSRLRAKLRSYYESEPGQADWVVEIPKGSYTPVWTAVHRPDPAPKARRLNRTMAITALGLLFAGVVWTSGYAIRQYRVRRDLQRAESIVPPAKDLFLRSHRERSARPLASLLEAASLYRKCAEARPHDASIWLGLARTLWYAGDYDARIYERAEAAARHALELDAGLAEAEFYLGHIEFFQHQNLPEAYRRMKRAIEIDPSSESYYRYAADLSALLGRPEEGLRLIEAGKTRLPNSEVLALSRLSLLTGIQRWTEVESQASLLLRDRPELHVAHRLLAQAFLETGRSSEAETEFQRCLTLMPEDKPCLTGLGRLYASKGKKPQAMEVVDRLRRLPMHAVPVALVYAALRDKQSALKWVRVAEETHDDALPYLFSGGGISLLSGDAAYESIAAKYASR